MAKKIVTLLMIAVMLLSMVPTALMESEPGYMTDEQIMGIDPKDWPKTMYVSTKNKGKLNVRSEPKSGKNVIGQLDYGTKVTVLSPVIINADWSVIKFSKGKVKWNTVVAKVYASDRNYWTASAVIGRRVKAIAPYAFESAPNIQTLYVRSPKLKKYSKVHSSLANSNVSWVWVSGMSSSNVRKVVDAFNSWAWMG